MFLFEKLCGKRIVAFLWCCRTSREMASPQGLDDLFWGREYEDITNWAERLTMAAEVRDLTPDKLFKIVKLNLRGRAKEWFRRLQPAPTDWTEL